jgi:hypothetical protein
LMSELQSHDSTSQLADSTFLGVLDGLFVFIARIRSLRDQVRQRRATGLHWWDDDIMRTAFDIDTALRDWNCIYPVGSPRYAASLLYRQCTWIYLYRTTQHSQSSPGFRDAVDQGLTYLRELRENENINSIILLPLFLLGCAAFEPSQRPEMILGFQRLQAWSGLGNIKHARTIVEDVWKEMDVGNEQGSWDWESVIARKGWDFLVT